MPRRDKIPGLDAVIQRILHIRQLVFEAPPIESHGEIAPGRLAPHLNIGRSRQRPRRLGGDGERLATADSRVARRHGQARAGQRRRLARGNQNPQRRIAEIVGQQNRIGGRQQPQRAARGQRALQFARVDGARQIHRASLARAFGDDGAHQIELRRAVLHRAQLHGVDQPVFQLRETLLDAQRQSLVSPGARRDFCRRQRPGQRSAGQNQKSAQPQRRSEMQPVVQQKQGGRQHKQRQQRLKRRLEAGQDFQAPAELVQPLQQPAVIARGPGPARAILGAHIKFLLRRRIHSRHTARQNAANTAGESSKSNSTSFVAEAVSASI
ncbi:MAG: hypothetical protein BWZ10_02407 [candidate division BRC1 bacterium ADurb.BinA364]|nr:MAG: hypothetical protein BWZ10_02407 [candidate division BRC1 bacterium ADurb.BinA364]